MEHCDEDRIGMTCFQLHLVVIKDRYIVDQWYSGISTQDPLSNRTLHVYSELSPILCNETCAQAGPVPDSRMVDPTLLRPPTLNTTVVENGQQTWSHTDPLCRLWGLQLL